MAYLVGMNPIAARSRTPGRGIFRNEIIRAPAAVHTPPPPTEPIGEILESAILPRLMAAHGLMPQSRERAWGQQAPLGLEVEALAPLAMGMEADALLDHVDALLRDGLSIDSLFVDLLAPAARHLGLLWEQDRCDFIEVTMGLWRLQEVVRELSARLPPEYRPSCYSRRALFAAVPGDQHSFGTVMIDETFRRDGWDTDALLEPTTSQLIECVAREWFDIVGLTVSCDCNIEPLPNLVHALRSVSRNPRIIVMVGGRVFVEDPSLAVAVGADGTAADAVEAVAVADGLVDALAHGIFAAG